MRIFSVMTLQGAFFFGMIMALSLPLPASAQEPAGGKKAEEAPREEKKEEEKKEEKKKKEDRYFALRGGDVYTVSGPVLKDTDILVKNGVIEALGRDLKTPDECDVLDASGMRVYPGLIAVSSYSILGREPPENSTDLFGINMRLALAGGLTTVVTGNTAGKLTFGTTEGMVVKRKLFTSLSYSRRYPEKRRKLREDLARVRRYIRDLEAFEAEKAAGGSDPKEPDKSWLKGNYENYYKLLKGESIAKISAYMAQDLRDACELAHQFSFRLVIEGGLEAWTLPGLLGRAGVHMIITPRRKAEPDPRKAAPTGWNIQTAKILYDHGVNFAILPRGRGISLGGITGRDLLALPMEAAYAVRGGLPEEAALEAITLGAARVLGLDKRLGSIEVGKDGDFIVCDGDLLHYNTLVQWTVVNGRIVYDKQEESLFAHIRPRDGSDGKVIEFWPRPVETMPDFEALMGTKKKEESEDQ